VPVIWISAVLDQLIQKLGDQRVFVLSVLGLQSSGKSTMLNTMFGLQSAVSAGRTTRGAFMQLLRVSDERPDFILVIDTEGLHAPELSGRSTRDHDNELATFVFGLANLTLINIFGENPSEMLDILQIVVQAFMRMKKVRLNPSCVFVHQNVSDVTAGERNMEKRRRLQETLDEMTKLAAKDEVCDAECFSDVISFDVQKDVKYIPHLWEGNPPMAPPNPNYCENIQELKKTIMTHFSKSHGIRLKDLNYRIKDLWEALLYERFVFSFRNSLEISAYRKLETEYRKWSWSLRSAMLKTENKLYNRIENEAIHEVKETDLQKELKKTSEEVKKSVSEFFEKDRDKYILIQWKTSFEIKIRELQENIVRETKRRLNEILQQRDLKKKIDAQRTHHEYTLYEKSKELALKLKDRTNEETLKREFDLFWEQCVKEIIRDTPPIRDIDIMRDVREIFIDIYESVPVAHWTESRDIFTVKSYSDYVQLKKSSGFTGALTNIYRSHKEKFGYILSPEDESQIRSFVTDVAQQTDRMIQSSNISKMGYNISYIQQITDYIKTRVTQHVEGSVRYVFKNEFFIHLVLSICERSNKMITDQHTLFREANDPVLYLKKKREEYYSIFQKYCHGAASAAMFGEIICQKLKEPIEQSIYKKTARDLADEMKNNCESLNGNRTNLEKHILKKLAEEEDFDKYMNYIHNPRDHFKRFIRDEVSRYITDQFSDHVLPEMKKNIKLLEQKIMEAAHQSTERVQENRGDECTEHVQENRDESTERVQEHRGDESTERVQEHRGDESTERVQENRGDAGLWLKSFTQQLSDDLIFSEKDLSGVKHDDVDDFNLLEDMIRYQLIVSDIRSGFSRESFAVRLDYKFRPDEVLIDHFCQCCWVQCPFCGATCTCSIENHDGYHSAPLHRVRGIIGTCYHSTQNLCTDICTHLVRSNHFFSTPYGGIPFEDYRRAGGDYADWSNTPDFSEQPYWKWFVCRFQKDLEKHYNKTFQGSGKIPGHWRRYTKQDALESLDNKGENKDIVTAEVRAERTEYLFHKLHLKGRYSHKLRAADVLQITEHSLQTHESCAEEELIQTYIQKLLMMNYTARYITNKEMSEQHHTQQRDSDSPEDESDIFESMYLSNKGTSQSDLIHPMDVQMAVFLRADGLLKQLMATKLSQCQFALPLLVPHPFTQQIEFPLKTFTQINKSWKIRNTYSEIISQTQPIYRAETPMVLFFRFGSVSSSKSQLMNHLINEKHNTFFHRHCPSSSRKKLQENIVREIKRRLNEILQQRDLKKKIDDQRTHHENTLYEKSKELALILRDRTTDETLKKEFDVFWEQCVKNIIRDTPPIRDIDIMRDMKILLSDIYESVSADHWTESRDIFTVTSYSDYVRAKRYSGTTGAFTNAIRSAKEKFGYILSPEDESQIRSFVTDVALQTDRMIQSFNISKMGYNISYIQQLTDYIKTRVTQHKEERVRYVFKNEFFMDLVLSI
ncbi:hypothetical protein cypCar_00046427, partial [Cyprinus carpio]